MKTTSNEISVRRATALADLILVYTHPLRDRPLFFKPSDVSSHMRHHLDSFDAHSAARCPKKAQAQLVAMASEILDYLA